MSPQPRCGIYLNTQDDTGRDPAALVADIFEQASLAEQLGFSSLFVGQHFLSAPIQMLQPIPLLAALAREVERPQLGAGVLLGALLNPVEVAENAATLDLVSGGRVVLCFGLGYRDEENAAFGVTERRGAVLRQKVDVVRRLLEGEAVTASGSGYSLEAARISIRPAQQPRPPIWMGAITDVGVRRAAALGDAWFMDPIPNAQELERQLALFAELRGGGLPDERPIMREVCVAETDAEAFELARAHLVPKYETYARWGMIDEFRWDEDDTRFFTGSPVRVRQQIEAFLERVPATHLVMRVQWPGVPQARALESMRLLAGEMLPPMETG